MGTVTDLAPMLLTYLAGAASGGAAAFFTPLRSATERYGRRALERSPVDVHIETDLERIWAGYPDWVGVEYFFPGATPPHESTPSLAAFQSFAKRYRATNCGMATLKVTVVSRSAATVVIGAPVVEATCSEMPEGVRIARPAPGGASMEPTAVDIEFIEGMSPLTSVHHPGGQDRGPISWVLKAGEAQQFLIRASAVGDIMWRWHAVLPLIVDGRSRDAEVGSSGHPFTLCGRPFDRWGDLWAGPDGWQPAPTYPVSGPS